MAPAPRSLSRAARVAKTAAQNFGMHDQHIPNVYIGADRLALGPEWNARPSRDNVKGPRIIHWAGGQKPWVEGDVSDWVAWTRHVDAVVRWESAIVAGPAPGPMKTESMTRESV